MKTQLTKSLPILNSSNNSVENLHVTLKDKEIDNNDQDKDTNIFLSHKDQLEYEEEGEVRERGEDLEDDNIIPNIIKREVLLNTDEYINDELNLIYTNFEEYLDKLDYKHLNAPIITNTFHIQRKLAYNKLCQLIKDLPWNKRILYLEQFVNKIDHHYLQQFKSNIKESYINLIFQKHYNIPTDYINIHDIKKTHTLQQLYNLCVIIAIWTIEVEYTIDIIERAALYGLYDHKKNDKIDYKQKFKVENIYKYSHNRFNLKGYMNKTLRRYGMIILDKLSTTLLAKGFNFQYISCANFIEILSYILGRSVFPWQFIIGSINIPWICGGYILSKLLGKLSEKIMKDEIIKDLTSLENVMNENIIEMMDVNKKMQENILHAYQSSNISQWEYIKDIIQIQIDSILNYNPKKSKNMNNDKLNQTHLNDNQLSSLDKLLVKESKDLDGWILCDFKGDNQSYGNADNDDDDDDYVIY